MIERGWSLGKRGFPILADPAKKLIKRLIEKCWILGRREYPVLADAEQKTNQTFDWIARAVGMTDMQKLTKRLIKSFVHTNCSMRHLYCKLEAVGVFLQNIRLMVRGKKREGIQPWS